MRADNSYIKDDMAYKIALLAIYMPIIRKEVFEWRDTWNTHQIRRQSQSLTHLTTIKRHRSQDWSY